MTSSTTFAVFLSLLCLASGQHLPLQEGTTLGALLESPVWGALLNTITRVTGQVESTLENWTDYVAETVHNRLVPQLLTEPFVAGYQNEEAISRRTGTSNADDTYFPDDLEQTVFLAYDHFLDDVNNLREEALDIVGEIPNWLNLENLKNVDLSQLEFSPENLLTLLSDALNVPEDQSSRIQALFNNTKELIPAHGYKLGSQTARLANNAKGLATAYLPILAKNVVKSVKSYPPRILSSLQTNAPMLLSSLQSYSPMLLSSLQSYSPMLLSSLQSHSPMLLSSLQSYSPMITSFLVSNMGSIMPMLSAFL